MEDIKSYTQTNIQEALIAMEYLLRFTSKDKPAMASNIIKYAKEKYDVNIRRQHLSEVLKTLADNDFITDSLGFRIDNIEFKRNNGNNTHKYFVSRRSLNDDKIIDLAISLKRSYHLSDESIASLTETLIEDNPFIQNKEYVRDTILHDIDIKNKINKRTAAKLKILRKAKYDKSLITIVLRKWNEGITKIDITGYVYDIVANGKKIIAYIIRPINHDLFPVNLSFIEEIKNIVVMKDKAPDLNALYKSDKYSCIEEEIFNSGIIINKKVVELSFKTKCPSLIAVYFKNVFKKDLPEPYQKEFIKNDSYPKGGYYVYSFKFTCDRFLYFDFLNNPEVAQRISHVQPEVVRFAIRHHYLRMAKRFEKDFEYK